MKILVTGGAGFIGSNLSRRLLDIGASVRVIDDLSTGLRSNLDGLGTELVVGSICDAGLVDIVAADCDVIIHLAARGSVPRSLADPEGTLQVNISGTQNILDVARRRALHCVIVSSSSVYGANPANPKTEEDYTRPLSPYGASKLAAESLAHAYALSYGTPTTTFRLFNVYGPRQRPDHDYAAVLPRWIQGCLDGVPITLQGDGSQSRDFTYVETVVEVLCATISRRVLHPAPVNLAYGRSISLNQVLEELETIFGSLPPVDVEPPRKGDIKSSQNSPALVRTLFPEIGPIDFRDGLLRTVEWFQLVTSSR